MPEFLQRLYRLVVSDLDGTLLNSDHEVSSTTACVLEELIARGTLFTVATGKTFPSTTRHIERFGIKVPVICSNGTLVHAPDGTILHEESLALGIALDSIRMAREANVMPIVYSGTGLVADRWDDGIDELMAHHEPEPEIVPDLEEALHNSHKPDKIIFINGKDLQAVADFQTLLEKKYHGQAQVLRSGLASLFEVLPMGVPKGTALSFILDYLEMAPEQVIAFGDNCNDVDMIRRAGLGVAMGNSPADVREAADYVTGSNDDDGVAHALQKHVLDFAACSD